jgi:hypothetical protein
MKLGYICTQVLLRAHCKRSFLARLSTFGVCGFPVPGQKIIEAVHGMSVGHACEHVFEVSVGLNVIELRRCEKRGDHGPSIRAAVGAGEQMVFSAQSQRPDGALDRIGIEFDTTVIQEPAQGRPARERVWKLSRIRTSAFSHRP